MIPLQNLQWRFSVNGKGGCCRPRNNVSICYCVLHFESPRRFVAQRHTITVNAINDKYKDLKRINNLMQVHVHARHSRALTHGLPMANFIRDGCFVVSWCDVRWVVRSGELGCTSVHCVPKALLPEGNGRDVYPRVQVNRRAMCIACAPCVSVWISAERGE